MNTEMLDVYYDNDSDFDPDVFISSGSRSRSPYSSEENPEEESEEDLHSDEEVSESQGLVDGLNIELELCRFLEAKVQEAEHFYDSKALRPALLVDAGVQTEPEEGPSLDPRRSRSPITCSTNDMKTVEMQTDTASATELLFSFKVSKETADWARKEFDKLRDAKEPLNLERKGLSDRLKVKKKTAAFQQMSKTEERLYKAELEREERQLCELEETVEAIDLAISYKNEVISGHEPLLTNAPGQEKADLVTRLASLSVFELQRLFCQFFLKVVELRCCTKNLEGKVDQLREERERLKRIIHMNEKNLKQKDAAHDERLKNIMHISGLNCLPAAKSTAIVEKLTEDLHKAHRKVEDYKVSLTELLVRQGLLLNGADYNVQQVIKMLGLDPQDLHGGGPSNTLPLQIIASSHHHQGPRRTIHQRRNAEIHTKDNTHHPLEEPGGGSSSSPRKTYNHNNNHNNNHTPSRSQYHHPSTSRQEQEYYKNHRQQPHSSRYAQIDERERNGHGHDRHGQSSSRHHNYNHQDEAYHPTAVKRTKNKLIIEDNR